MEHWQGCRFSHPLPDVLGIWLLPDSMAKQRVKVMPDMGVKVLSKMYEPNLGTWHLGSASSSKRFYAFGRKGSTTPLSRRLRCGIWVHGCISQKLLKRLLTGNGLEIIPVVFIFPLASQRLFYTAESEYGGSLLIFSSAYLLICFGSPFWSSRSGHAIRDPRWVLLQDPKIPVLSTPIFVDFGEVFK